MEQGTGWGGRFQRMGSGAVTTLRLIGSRWIHATEFCKRLAAAPTAFLVLHPTPESLTGAVGFGAESHLLIAKAPNTSTTVNGVLEVVGAEPLLIAIRMDDAWRTLTVFGNEAGDPPVEVQRIHFYSMRASDRLGRLSDPLPPPVLAPTPTAQPASSMPTSNELTALYTTRLQNTVLTLQKNNFDSDYSGGSTYYDKGTSIKLASATFRQEDWNFSRVSVAGLEDWTLLRMKTGGMTLSSSSPQVRQGTWSVTPSGAQMLLVLKDYGGSKRSSPSSYRILAIGPALTA